MFVDQQQGTDVFPHFLDGLLLVFLNVLVIISSASELKTEIYIQAKFNHWSSNLEIFTLRLVTNHFPSVIFLVFSAVSVKLGKILEMLAASLKIARVSWLFSPLQVSPSLDVLHSPPVVVGVLFFIFPFGFIL